MTHLSHVKSERSFHQLYTIISCPCGRDLRVKRALAGTEVRCWDCHQMVMVLFPSTTGLVLSGMGHAIGNVLERNVVATIAVGAAVVTGLLYLTGSTIPVAAAGFMVVAAAGYGELIRRCGSELPERADGEEDEENADATPAIRPAWLGFRTIGAIAMGLGLSAPWLLTPRDLQHMPRLSPLTFGLGLVGCVVVPLLMFLAYARDRSGPLGMRKATAALIQHPLVVAVSLVLFPLAVVLAEAITFALTSFFGWFPFMLLELFPNPRGICQTYGIPYDPDYFLGGLPEPRFLRIYPLRLGQGYSLLGAIPHSLGLHRFQYGFAWGFPVLRFAYLAQRILYTHLMLCIIFLALALQARWLGVLSTIESHRLEA